MRQCQSVALFAGYGAKLSGCANLARIKPNGQFLLGRLGGYVKMLDARDTEQTEIAAVDAAARIYPAKRVGAYFYCGRWPRRQFLAGDCAICVVTFNRRPEPSTRLRAVPESSPAYQAGLRGDVKKLLQLMASRCSCGQTAYGSYCSAALGKSVWYRIPKAAKMRGR